MGVSDNWGCLILGVLIIRILLFRVLYWGPLFSETPIFIETTTGIIYSLDKGVWKVWVIYRER